MDRIQLQKLRDLPIEGVAERLNLRVERHKCLCPFHEDHHASLSFRNNRYKCYACGERGDTISLAMKRLGKGFIEACKWLANESLTPIPSPRERGEKSPSPYGEAGRGLFDASRYEKYFEHPWLSPRDCKFLFEKRRLHPAVVRYCRLNSFRDWLQIPYYSQEGKLIGIQRRYMGTDPAQPRFRFPYGKGCHLYGLPVLRRLGQNDSLYIAEGPSDAWSLLSSGCRAIATPSATLFNKQEMLREFQEADIFGKGITLHIFPDKDDAGTYLYGQLLDFANENGLCLVRHNLPEGCKDFADYWAAQKA